MNFKIYSYIQSTFLEKKQRMANFWVPQRLHTLHTLLLRHCFMDVWMCLSLYECSDVIIRLLISHLSHLSLSTTVYSQLASNRQMPGFSHLLEKSSCWSELSRVKTCIDSSSYS